ncbi:MAG: tonB-system energizer ExbB [Alphaproteobacteria bacterium]|nr:tonB-system energizer ExbB [Alphaproteobacteria bacterium]
MRVSRLFAILIFLPALAMAQTAPTPATPPVAAPPATSAPATTPPAATPPTTTPPATTSPTTTPPTAAPSTDATPVTPPAASTETAPVASPTAPPAPTVAAALPRDLSVLGMFLAADWVVQAVMIGLVVASVLTWTVFLAKSLELAAAHRRQTRALAAIDSAPSLDAAPANDLVAAAQVERKLSVDNNNDRDGLKERIASRLERLEAATGRRMLKGTGVLATIGATAPFVGLFGTVWGIMNSFIGISKSQTTNLAVVAPGIAEALLATALGLAAAIPAVVIYNHFSRRIAAYRALVGDTSAAVLRLVSRDIGKAGAK